MENYDALARFCRRFAYTVEHKHVTSIWPDDTRVKMRLHCFASAADAEEFAAHFEGEHFDPVRDRGKGKDRNAWRRTGPPEAKEQYGPLRMPKFFQDHP